MSGPRRLLPVVARSVALAGAILVAAVLTGCRPHAAIQRDTLLVRSVPATVEVRVRSVPGLGAVLTDGAGHTLYMFPPDAGSRASCTGPCTGTWPPLACRTSHPTAGGGVNGSVLATRPDPNSGARIVTYAGYPLYRYAGDTTAGTANGQGLFLDGGPWYALTPAGNPITVDPPR
jgi:predicted lipoprotein with Yx(FWY)xxD motif